MLPQEREGRSWVPVYYLKRWFIVLANNHVVEGAETVIVRLNDRREFVAEIVGTDPRSMLRYQNLMRPTFRCKLLDSDMSHVDSGLLRLIAALA